MLRCSLPIGTKLPVTVGREIGGEVAEPGSDVHGLVIADEVVIGRKAGWSGVSCRSAERTRGCVLNFGPLAAVDGHGRAGSAPSAGVFSCPHRSSNLSRPASKP